MIKNLPPAEPNNFTEWRAQLQKHCAGLETNGVSLEGISAELTTLLIPKLTGPVLQSWTHYRNTSKLMDVRLKAEKVGGGPTVTAAGTNPEADSFRLFQGWCRSYESERRHSRAQRALAGPKGYRPSLHRETFNLAMDASAMERGMHATLTGRLGKVEKRKGARKSQKQGKKGVASGANRVRFSPPPRAKSPSPFTTLKTQFPSGGRQGKSVRSVVPVNCYWCTDGPAHSPLSCPKMKKHVAQKGPCQENCVWCRRAWIGLYRGLADHKSETSICYSCLRLGHWRNECKQPSGPCHLKNRNGGKCGLYHHPFLHKNDRRDFLKYSTFRDRKADLLRHAFPPGTTRSSARR